MAICSILSKHELNSIVSWSFKALTIELLQEDALWNFLNGNDVLVWLPTDEGKPFCSCL